MDVTLTISFKIAVEICFASYFTHKLYQLCMTYVLSHVLHEMCLHCFFTVNSKVFSLTKA